MGGEGWGRFLPSMHDCSRRFMDWKKTHTVGVRACTASKETQRKNTTKQEIERAPALRLCGPCTLLFCRVAFPGHGNGM